MLSTISSCRNRSIIHTRRNTKHTVCGNFTWVEWMTSSHVCWSVRMTVQAVVYNQDIVHGEVMPSLSWFRLQTLPMCICVYNMGITVNIVASLQSVTWKIGSCEIGITQRTRFEDTHMHMQDLKIRICILENFPFVYIKQDHNTELG